jgi:hypothetical protein
VRNLLELLRDPFTTRGEDEAFLAALQPSGAAAASPSTKSSAPGSTSVPERDALPGDDYRASAPAGAEGEGGAPVCVLSRKYDGRPPAWASKLCVTCSS